MRILLHGWIKREIIDRKIYIVKNTTDKKLATQISFIDKIKDWFCGTNTSKALGYLHELFHGNNLQKMIAFECLKTLVDDSVKTHFKKENIFYERNHMYYGNRILSIDMQSDSSLIFEIPIAHSTHISDYDKVDIINLWCQISDFFHPKDMECAIIHINELIHRNAQKKIESFNHLKEIAKQEAKNRFMEMTDAIDIQENKCIKISIQAKIDTLSYCIYKESIQNDYQIKNIFFA